MASIEVDRFLPHPPTTVWRALTDPELLGRWLMPNDFVPTVGHRFTFRADPVRDWDGVVQCEVVRLEADRELTISWRGGPGLDTTVTWRLEAEGRGTRLFLVHDGFDGDDPDQAAVMRILGGGWRGHLAARLDAILEEV